MFERHMMRRYPAAIAFALACAAASGRLAAQAPAGASAVTGPGVTGVPWTGAKGVTEPVSILNGRGAAELALGPRKILVKVEFEGPDRDILRMNPLSPAVSTWPPAAAEVARPVSPSIPQTVGVTFTAATLPEAGFVPPDTMGAIGPTQFVAIENGIIRSFGRNGVADGALNTTTDAFFASMITPGSSMSDPRVRFDWTSQRWIIVMIDVATPNRVLLAVSSGITIASTSSFTFFQFQQNLPLPAGNATCLADYPSVGIDANAVYIGVNQFCGATSSYGGSDGFVVRKSSILGAGPIVVTAFRGIGTTLGVGMFAPQGVDNDDPAATAGYFIGVDLTSFGVLDIRRVSTPGGTPTISGNIALTVPQTFVPNPQQHKGNVPPAPPGTFAGKLDGNDDRVVQSRIAKDGTLWTSHGVSVNSSGVAGGAPGDRNALRWYQIGSLSTTPALVQSGTIFDPAATNPLGFTYGSVEPNRQGHAAFAMTAVGPTSFADAAQSGRLASDTPGFANAPIKFTASAVAYNPSFDPGATRPRRWGDYSAISLDPTDEMTLWATAEYTDSASFGGSWGVKVAQLLAPPPATPASALPATAATGTTPTVVITGTSVAGSGFYETTSGFSYSKHIAASVSGTGVSVTSVTFTSPTSISLALDVTAGAAAGARDVTVTNPDGQAATGVGILTVTGCTPPATPSASNTGPYCAGAAISLSTPTVATATYAWTGPNGFASALQNPTIPSAAAVNAGTYSVTVTVAGCTSLAGQTTVAVNAVPATPVITTLPAAGAGSPNRAASVVNHAGSTYLWSITNGTITSATNTNAITFTAGTAGTPLTLSVVETNASLCPSAAGTANVSVLSADSALQFYTLTPCRVLDTRNPAGPFGGPSIAGGAQRTFVLTGQCGIPAGARAVSMNTAVWIPPTRGDLRVFPAGGAVPVASTLNWEPNILALANAAVVTLGSSGAITVQVDGPGTVDIFFDVNGYFQ